MARIAFLGDTHANIVFVEQFYDYIDKFDVDAIIQVGDFGYGFHERKPELGDPTTYQFLDRVDAVAADYNIPMYWIDGNHENHDSLNEYYVQGRYDEFIPVRDNVLYIPRGKTWEWDGVKFMGFGGAHSVNWSSLVKYVSWWPNEIPTMVEIGRAASRGAVDVLITHDVCHLSDINHRMGLSHIDACEFVRNGLDIVAKHARPKKIIHGHYHFPWRFTADAEWGKVKIVALDADYTAIHMGDVFDIVDTREYTRPPKEINHVSDQLEAVQLG